MRPYSTLNPLKVTNFNGHFVTPKQSDIPSPDFRKHLKQIKNSAIDRVQCKEFQYIFTFKNDKTHFYCSSSKFNQLFALSNTFGNIKSLIWYKHNERD